MDIVTKIKLALEDWQDGYGCYVSNKIIEERKPIAYAKRVKPVNEEDSGWIFASSNEEKLLDEKSKNYGKIYTIEQVLERDQDLLKIINSPYESKFVRDESGNLVKVEEIHQ